MAYHLVMQNQSTIKQLTMKKTLLWAVLCLIGVQSSSIAQETETEVKEITVTETVKKESIYDFYVGFGLSVLSDYNLNEKLAQSDMLQIGSVVPEFTFGFNMSEANENFYMDIEGSAGYMDEKNSTDRIRTVVSSAKLRPQYKLINNDKWFFSAGGDISYTFTYVDLFSRSNTIDLNTLDPSMHTGHISMYSDQLTIGPSVALGFNNKVFPVRFNFGYDFGVTNGKWKSEFADVSNTVKENGSGRFYAKVNIGF